MQKKGKKYYARFAKDDLQKNLYGDKYSDKKGKDALIKTGAEGYIFELVEHARYKNEKNETGKKRMLIKG